jgi:hypothetical protein
MHPRGGVEISTEVEGVATPIRHNSFQLRVPGLRTRPGKQVISTYWLIVMVIRMMRGRASRARR